MKKYLISIKIINEDEKEETLTLIKPELTFDELIKAINKTKITYNENYQLLTSKHTITKSKEKIKFEDKEELIIRDPNANQAHIIGENNGPHNYVKKINVNLKNKELQERNVKLKDPNIPYWRTVSWGINLFGFCENNKCKAFKNEVVNFKRVEYYDLIKDGLKMYCPECNCPVNGITIGFYNCYYNFYGKQIINKENDDDQEIKRFGKEIKNFEKVKIFNENKVNLNGEEYAIYKTKKNKATYFPIENNGDGFFSQLIFQMRKIE